MARPLNLIGQYSIGLHLIGYFISPFTAALDPRGDRGHGSEKVREPGAGEGGQAQCSGYGFLSQYPGQAKHASRGARKPFLPPLPSSSIKMNLPPRDLMGLRDVHVFWR